MSFCRQYFLCGSNYVICLINGIGRKTMMGIEKVLVMRVFSPFAHVIYLSKTCVKILSAFQFDWELQHYSECLYNV